MGFFDKECGRGFLAPTLQAMIVGGGGGGKPIEGEEKTVPLEMADGDQVITPTEEGGYLSKVTVEKPATLVSENIVTGVNIGGVNGSAVASDFDLNGLIARTAENLTIGSPTIGDYAFYNYTGLKTFTDNTATKIGQHAFDGCTGLTAITIPNVAELSDYALNNCKAIANIGALTVPTIGKNGAYYLAANAANGFVYEPSAPATIADYGLQYAKITEIKGEIKSVGQGGLANLPSTFTKFSGKFTGSIGKSGFANNRYLGEIDLSASAITNLGEYAFYYLGWERANYSTAKLTLDLRNSTFAVVNSSSFAYLRNTDVYLPQSVTQMNGYSFANCQNLNLYISGVAPVLPTTSTFSSATNYTIYVSWKYGASYKTATNWAALADKIFAIAEAGTFTAGETLPEYSGEGYAVTWYTDAEKTNAVTVCPEGSPMLYCSYSDAKAKEVVSISTSGPIDITVTDSTGAAVDFSLGYFLCNSGDEFSVNASTSETGYTYYIKVDGAKVTTFPYALTVTSDIAITGTAYDPTQINPDFTTATPQELKNAVDQGIAATTYAVGSTRQITLKNGQTITLRLANNTTDLYERSDGSGATGFVLEFVECFGTKYYMNTTNTNDGGWNACYMRTTVMPLILAQLPDEWQEVVATVKIKAGNGYSTQNVVIESDDKLFLPAEKEIFASLNYSSQTEWNALTRWQWYAQHDTDADRVKTFNGSAAMWWERSPSSVGNNYFCDVRINGTGFVSDAYYDNAVAPAFCI